MPLPDVSSDTPFLECRNLRLSYRIAPALELEHWRWDKGQNWALLGGNGAGKTTLARLLTDEMRPSSGSYQSVLQPKQVVHLSFDLQQKLMEHDRRFDDSETRPDAFDVGTTVAAAILQGQSPNAEFSALLERFDLARIADRGIRFISTGESRKTLLARALFQQPQLLILDNPLAGLDAAAQRELQQLLEEILQSGPPLLLLVSNPTEIPSGITHLLWLENGRVQAQGRRDQILAQYHSTASGYDFDAPLPPARPRPEPPADQPLIELRGLNLRYGETAILTDVHWRFERGQHSVIAGPNGAGKSTLLSVICGDNAKGYGQPLWLFGRKRGSGESVWDIHAHYGLVGTAWQLQRRRRERVLEVVASGLYDSDGLFRECTGSDRAAVLGWIRSAGLEPLAETPFDRLSFGQQRLALIARAMVKTPQILVLDEPCLGLDAEHRDAVLSLVERIAASGHTQLLYVSHRPEEIPRCINQTLTLVPHPEGGHTAHVASLSL